MVKAHHPTQDLAGLHESVRVQMHLASRGLYATTVCGGPAPIGRGARRSSRLRGERRHARWARAGGARGAGAPLYAIVAACRPLVAGSTLSPHCLARAVGRCGRRGNELCGALAAGAEWIDEVARAARARMQPAGEVVIGHGDWRGEQVLFDGGRVVAAHDWMTACVRSASRR